MREGTGRPVFSGVAIGKAYVYFPRQSELPASCGDSEIELKNFNAALETARNDTVAWVLTLFGIVSILASILSILQILAGGDPLAWFATIMSTLVIAVLVAVVLIFRRKDE